MTITRILVAAAALLAFSAIGKPAEARPYGYSFGYYGPGLSIYVGPRPYYYGPYYYRPYYPPPPVYRYRPAPRTYSYRPRTNRCGRWSNRCASRWGYGNRNYRGCMRYHRCR